VEDYLWVVIGCMILATVSKGCIPEGIM